MWVHFASGVHPFPEPWHNIDYLASTADVDQIVNLLRPLPPNLKGIEQAYVGHFLEHITPEEGVLLLLRIRARMAPGGLLVAVGPDVNKGKAMLEAGLIDQEQMDGIGKHGEPQGDYRGSHMWDCTGEAVVAQLKEAGWLKVEEFPLAELITRFPDIPMINPVEWQYAACGWGPE